MEFNLQNECTAFVMCTGEIFLQLLCDPPQFGAELLLPAHVAECAFCAYAFPLVLFRRADTGVAEAEVHLHEEVEGFFAEELGEVGSVGVDVAAGLDADSIEFALKDPAYAVDFSGWEVLHEDHDCGSVACDPELSIGFVAVGGNFCNSRVGGYTG